MTLTIVCQKCNKNTEKRWHGPQKYCEPCSVEIQRQRKIDWNRRHGREIAERRRPKVMAQYSKRREALIVAGAEESDRSAKNILWDSNKRPDLVHVIRLKFPFTWALSKNFQWGARPGGYVYLRREAKAMREVITRTLLQMDHGFVQGKIWLDICVQKPDHKGDAVNFVDAICDAVKKGIGVDDRWFSLGLVDWQIVKKEPWIIIAIGQEYREPRQVCCYCGAIKTYEHFQGKKKIGRECRDCRQRIRSASKDVQA